jgi:hypothetical protein
MRTRIALTCIAALAVAAPAQAAKPKPAIYQLTLKGSEADTWQYKAPPDGQCFYGAQGNGSQDVTYSTGTTRVKAVRSKLGDRAGFLQLVPLNDDLAQYGITRPLPAVARVEREGDITSSAGCGGTGHGTGTPPPKDCGIRYGRIQLDTGFSGRSIFKVAGEYDNFGRPAPGDTDDLVHPLVPPTDGEPLGAVYENCPLLAPEGLHVAYDELTPVTKKLRENQLPKKGKTIKLSGGRHFESSQPDGQRSGDTTVAWNLTLKRVK